MAGRPTSLTPEVQTAIVEALERGNYRRTAAQLAGVSERSLYNWEDRGETGEEPYASFLHAIKSAEAIAEDALLTEIRRAYTGTKTESAEVWQARAWVMERRWPKRWAARVRQAVSEELEAFTDRLQRKLDEPTYRKVIDASREDASSEGAEPRH